MKTKTYCTTSAINSITIPESQNFPPVQKEKGKIHFSLGQHLAFSASQQAKPLLPTHVFTIIKTHSDKSSSIAHQTLSPVPEKSAFELISEKEIPISDKILYHLLGSSSR